MAARVHEPHGIPTHPCGEPQERLAQLDPVALRRPVQPLDGAQDQVAVGRVCDGLGLHGRVHRDPLELVLADRLRLDGHGDGLGQHGLQIRRPDALTPPGHRRAIEGQAML